MVGHSVKAWWLAIGLPVVAFVAASILAALAVATVIVVAAEARRRWVDGARGRELIPFHHRSNE